MDQMITKMGNNQNGIELTFSYLPQKYREKCKAVFALSPPMSSGSKSFDIFFELSFRSRKIDSNNEMKIDGYYYNSNDPQLSELGTIWVDSTAQRRVG